MLSSRNLAGHIQPELRPRRVVKIGAADHQNGDLRGGHQAQPDLADAVQGAAMAFHAYLVPSVEDGYRYRDRHEDTSIVQYMAPCIVSAHFTSLVGVRVKTLSALQLTADVVRCERSCSATADTMPQRRACVLVCTSICSTDLDCTLAFVSGMAIRLPNGCTHMTRAQDEIRLVVTCGKSMGRTRYVPAWSPATLEEAFYLWKASAPVNGSHRIEVRLFGRRGEQTKPAKLLGSGSCSCPEQGDHDTELILQLTSQDVVTAEVAVDLKRVSVETLPSGIFDGSARNQEAAGLLSQLSSSAAGSTVLGTAGEIVTIPDARRMLADAWASLAGAYDRRRTWSLTQAAYFEVERTNTQGWISYDRAKRLVVISFRGTEGPLMTDVLTDISAWPVPLICHEELVGQAQRARALVHRGFQEAWQSAKDRILALLAMCVAEASTDGGLPWTVYVTGHSLGGAIATLCALHLKFSKPPGVGRIKVVTFGSPRVGNIAFTKLYNRAFEDHPSDSQRFANNMDIVSKIPPWWFPAPWLGYWHVKSGFADDGKGWKPVDDRSIGIICAAIAAMRQLGRSIFASIGIFVLGFMLVFLRSFLPTVWPLAKRILGGAFRLAIEPFYDHMVDEYVRTFVTAVENDPGRDGTSAEEAVTDAKRKLKQFRALGLAVRVPAWY